MKNYFFPVIFAIIFLTRPFSGFAQNQEGLKELDEYINSAFELYNLPGMAVAIVKDGEVVFSKGYGVKKVGENDKVTPSTNFAIASLSKAFTVASLGMLKDRGEINWNDKVTGYIPEFRLSDPWITGEMTIEDLLTHRSGLITFDGDLLWYGSNYSREEIISRIRFRPVTREFRNSFGYQNIMFITAGQLIPSVTGKSWDEFVKREIFSPLGMKNSNTSINDYNAGSDIAMPHLKNKPQELINYDNSGATAAINSNVDDLSNWIKFWLGKGVFNGDTLLSPSVVEKIFEPQTVLGTSSFDRQIGTNFKFYGMGWFLLDYKGKKVAHHGGGLPGYISKIAVVPSENLGMIILTNDMSSLPTALMYKILDFYLEGEQRDWAGLYHKFSESWEKREEEKREEKRALKDKKAAPHLRPEGYTGTYTDQMYGDANVYLEGKDLFLKLIPSAELLTGKLEHWHHDTYRVKFRDEFLPEGYVTFQLNSSGEVEGFKIDLPNPDFHFYKLDFKKKE